ncbi:MAG TPA: hypothetical protein VF474_15045 [Phenylobacterium sp.]
MAGEAGRSFAGGFFGCFGVIAAGVAMLFGLAFCAGLDSHRTDGRLADEDFRGSDYLSMCAAASVEVERGWRLGQVEASVDSPLLDAPGPPLRIRCAMNSSRKGAIEAVVTVRCANPLERSCHKVESVSTGALAVRAVP